MTGHAYMHALRRWSFLPPGWRVKGLFKYGSFVWVVRSGGSTRPTENEEHTVSTWKKIDAAKRSDEATKRNHKRPYALEGDTTPAEVAELRATLERVHLTQRGPAQDRARRMLQILDWFEAERRRSEELAATLDALREVIVDHPRAAPDLLVALKAVESTLETLCERDA